MSRRDVMKSWLRSAATFTTSRLAESSVAESAKRALHELTRSRLFITDSRLTAAAARVPEVSAATVSTREGQISVDLSFGDGPSLALRLLPYGVAFAAHGAKEWSVRVEPEGAALDPRAADVFIALAGEVARTLWGPFLRKQASPGKTGFAHRDGDTLIVDLRTLPDVRLAMSQRLNATGIDALSLESIEAQDGGLKLVPKLPGLPQV